MRKADVTIGQSYVVKVSGRLTHVRIISESPYGGWYGMNTATQRQVRIKTAGKLRRAVATAQDVVEQIEEIKADGEESTTK